MDAKAKAVREILHSGDQFVVPFFQRFYSWNRANWDRLKADLWTLLDDPSRKQHFLGPLVCAALKHQPGEIHGFQLIDGQQRITTISLMLAALRDVATDQAQYELAAEITETYLVHRFKKNWQQFKLVPRTGDREAFAAIVRQQSIEPHEGLGLVEAYHFFRKSIRQETHDRPERLRELFETIVGRLYLVVITISDENPYEIFESLNSTGLPLEESDLIRNFVFMQLRTEEQDDFHREHWQPYESHFEATGDYPSISATAFCRDFLMRKGEFSRLKATYLDFKSYYQRTNATPQSIVAELSRFARLELAILRGGDGLTPKAATALARFPMLDAATAHPLLLHLLDRHVRSEISVEDFVGCVQDIASFVFRRTVCGDQTGAYGKWFCEVIPQLKEKPRERLQAYLLHRGWPDDATFEARLLDFPLYRRDPKKCKLLLELLEESHGHKEMVNLKPLQIEHVMPQTIPGGKAGAPWREMLGDDWKAVHERWLHTIGNLTLTGYNPNLSNRPYADKRAELLKSNVTLNKCFESLPCWSEYEIVDRGRLLAQRASKLLPRPAGGGTYTPGTHLPAKPQAGRERRAAFWAQFVTLLEKRKSPWLHVKAGNNSTLPIPLPAYDASLSVQLVPAKREIVVRLMFARDRGKQMYASLVADRELVNQEFSTLPQWADGIYPEIKVVLANSSIRDPLDWLDQQEWIADQLAALHRAFHQRLAELHKTVKEKSPHKQLLFDYWCGFHDYLRDHDSFLSGVKPLPQVWNDFALGRTGCFLEALCNTTEQRIAVHLILSAKHADEWFAALEADAPTIEGEIGAKLEWHAPEETKQRHVILRKPKVDPGDRADWPNQFAWLHQTLERFHQVFHSRVRSFESPDEADES